MSTNEELKLKLAEAEIAALRARAAELEGAFNAFHKSLCVRFGYGHDDKDWRRDLLSLEEHIAGRVSKLTDRIDMQNDEFRRIEYCPSVSSEIAGLCQRAQRDIKQNVPVIVQRDNAERSAEKAEAQVAALRDENNTLAFRLASVQNEHADHEKDYLAVWKLIKQPNESVVDAVKRVVEEAAALRARVEILSEFPEDEKNSLTLQLASLKTSYGFIEQQLVEQANRAEKAAQPSGEKEAP